MTRPTMIALVQDGREQVQKVVIRSLLFSTADRGCVVENMYVVLLHKHEKTVFAFWGYQQNGQMERGGGLFVGREGVACNHHFVLLSKTDPFQFQAGEYELAIYATLVGKQSAIELARSRVSICGDIADTLNRKTGGVMFNWNPSSNEYFPDTSPSPC